jgi:hypothetical protein
MVDTDNAVEPTKPPPRERIVGMTLELSDHEPASERAGQRSDGDVGRRHDAVSSRHLEVDTYEADECPAEECRDRGDDDCGDST